MQIIEEMLQATPLKFHRHIYALYLNGMHSEVRIGKHLFDNFPIQNGLKQGGAIDTAHQLGLRICNCA
jgi:hypothetical protein